MTRIFTRIFLSYLLIGLSSAMVITVIYYFIMRDALIDRTYDQLSSINILKKDRLDTYFRQAKKNSEYLFTHDSFLENFYPGRPTGLTSETFPPEMTSEILAIKELFNYSSITVLDANLDEVYSTGHEMDFKHLLKVTPAPGEVPGNGTRFYFIDASDSVSARATRLLYVVELYQHDEHRASVIIIENFPKVQDILNQNTGMGNSGESYLVGNDRRLRSASRFLTDKPPLEISVNETAAYDSLHIVDDYRGIEVVSVRRQLGEDSPPWSIYSEMDLDEAMGPVNSVRNYLLIIMALLLIVTAAVTAIVSNAITKPILYLREIIIRLSKGVIPGQHASVSNRDEVGQIAEAINQLIGGLERTTKFAYAIGAGKFDVHFEKLSDKDALGEALMHMRDQIRTLNEQEVKLVREKAAALLEGQENERKRITRELHDGVGQLLTVIRLRTEGITGHDTLVQEIKGLLSETANEVKRISFNVMPSSLVDFGLEAALDGLCKQIRKSGAVAIDYQYIREVEGILPFDIVVAGYRIAQEALNNVLKHAVAQHVALHVIQKGDELFILIEDDGKGFDRSGKPASGYGLRSMEERAKLLGGSVEVHSEPHKGTAVEVHIPVR